MDAAASKAAGLGGRIVKEPYLTYYNAWQAVLEDVEQNVFRANHKLTLASGEAPGSSDR